MYALTVCMWLKSNASPGVGTPFSYAVPGQANELVLIEWGNNPMEILINDKVWLKRCGKYWILKLFRFTAAHFCLPLGCKAAFPHQRWEVASYLCHLDHSWWRMGGFSRWSQEGKWGESGALSSHQTTGPADPWAGAGKHAKKAYEGMRDLLEVIKDGRQSYTLDDFFLPIYIRQLLFSFICNRCNRLNDLE